MDAALFVADESKSQLVSGVAIKLRTAAVGRLNQVPLPTSKESVTGVKWKRLALAAELSDTEMGDLRDWIEEAYSEAIAERFCLPLPSVSSSLPRPSIFLSSITTWSSKNNAS